MIETHPYTDLFSTALVSMSCSCQFALDGSQHVSVATCRYIQRKENLKLQSDFSLLHHLERFALNDVYANGFSSLGDDMLYINNLIL